MAWQMNNRPRKVHGFRTRLQVYNEMLQLAQMPTREVTNQVLRLVIETAIFLSVKAKSNGSL